MARNSRPALSAALALAGILQAQSATIRFGEVSGQPGEIVALPVHCTFDLTLIGAWIAFRFDPARIEPLSYSVEGTAAAGADPSALFLNLYQDQGMCGISVHERGTHVNPGSMQIPPGEDVCIGRLHVRIRADAPLGRTPLPPAESFRVSETVVLFWRDGMKVNATSIVLAPGGGVTVTAPVGPRPVGHLTCTQVVEEALLAFTLTEAYDSIEIRRDGAVCATLPGTQAGFSNVLGVLGRIEYAVVAFRGDVASIPIVCELVATPPAAPPVKDLACGETGLQWSNPIVFDRILVLRDGELLAELPGTAGAYVDPARPPNVTVYTVVSELKGYPSPDANCVDNGVWVLEIQSVQVPLDATEVRVPILATTAEATRGFCVALDIDQSRFALVTDPERSIQDTVLYPEPDWLVVNINPRNGLPTASVVFDLTPSEAESYKVLSPGLRQPVMNFYFTPLGTFAPGESFPVGMVYKTETGGVIETLLTSLAGLVVTPVTLLPGEIVFGAPDDLTVKRLKGAVSSATKGTLSDIRLTWTNRAAYDSILVERNGERIAELPGASQVHTDRGVEHGVFTYKVIAVKDGQSGFPADLFVSTIPAVRTFLRGDANRDGEVDIGDPIFLLKYIFAHGPPPPCADAADANDDGLLTIADPIFSLIYLFGTGAVIHSPGASYPWFDPTPDALTCAE